MDEDLYQVLDNWHKYWNTINGPRVLVVDKVGPFSTVFLQKVQKVVGVIPLVEPRMHLDYLNNLIREMSYSHYFEVGTCGCVDYLKIGLESGRNSKNLKKLSRFNAVIKIFCMSILLGKMYRFKQRSTKIDCNEVYWSG